MSNSNPITEFGRYGLTPEHLLGYTYAGLLTLLYCVILFPAEIKGLIDTLGGLISVFMVVGLGIGVFVFYFRIIGDFFIYPFQHIVHFLIDRIRNVEGSNSTSIIWYLGNFGVPLGMRRAAYQTCKAEFISKDVRLNVFLSHGELHVLYLTSIETFIVWFYYLKSQLVNNYLLLVIGIICFLGAILGDTYQHILETRLLKAAGRTRLKNFLIKHGFVT